MRVVLVDDQPKWIDLVSRLYASNWVAFDTETTGLDTNADGFEVVGMSFAFDSTTGYYLPIGHRLPIQRLMFDKNGREPKPIVQLPKEVVLPVLRRVFSSLAVIGHNIKYDYQAMKRMGVKLENIVYDTMGASHIIDERGEHGLKELVEKLFHIKAMKIEELCQATGSRQHGRSNFELVHPADAAPYAAADAVNTVRLRDKFRPWFRDNRKFFDLLSLEVTLIPITAEMEMVGTNLDTGHLVALRNKIAAEEKQHRDEFLKGINSPYLNPASTKQMAELIYETMQVPLPRGYKKIKGKVVAAKGLFSRKMIEKMVVSIRTAERTQYGPWTKDDVLRAVGHYQKMKKLGKIRDTYTESLIDAVSDDGRLHTEFKQFGTRSGRYASEAPNFQNMPRNTDPDSPTYKYDIRKAFRADPGWVYVMCDYDAMEMRIAAAMSGCQLLSGILTGKQRDGHGEKIDVHLNTACAAFNLKYDDVVLILKDKKHPRYAELKEKRQKAKPVNFGILYGITEYGLAADLNETVEFARIVIAGFMRAYPGVARWMQLVKEYLKVQLYTETAFGRRRRIGWQEANDPEQYNTAYRACLNHIIQGTGADIVKQSMIKVARRIERDHLAARIAGQIHDEIIMMCPTSEYIYVAKMLQEEMSYELHGIPLPASAEVKTTWSKLEEPLWKAGA